MAQHTPPDRSPWRHRAVISVAPRQACTVCTVEAMVRSRFFAGLVLLLAMVMSACSGSVDFSFGGQTPAEAAVDLIEGEAMAQRLGVSTITDAVCQDPPNRDVGTVFTCTSQSDGQAIEFDVVLEDEDRIFAGPTNVVDPAGLSRLEVVAVQELNRQNDFGLPEDALQCGDGGAILDADMQMTCELTEPETGQVFDAVVTVADTETGDFGIVIVGEAAP